MWIKGPFPTGQEPPLGILKFDFNWKFESSCQSPVPRPVVQSVLLETQAVICESSTWKIPGSAPRCGNCGLSNLQKQI